MVVATIILIGPEDRQRPDLIRTAQAPRLDYRLVAQYCDGEILECCPSPPFLSGPKVVRLLRCLSGNMARAADLIRSLPNGVTIYSTGETWGLPVSLVGGMLKHRRSYAHVVYVHRVYSPLWLFLIRVLRPLMRVDGWMCATQRQADLLRQVLGVGNARVEAISQGVDTLFFHPTRTPTHQTHPYILSISVEMRDYSLLFQAVRDLDVQVILKMSSTWMTKSRQRVHSFPPNVTLLEKFIPYSELRDLYAGASLVVVPLHDTLQAAGISTILEAMAMRKCVIATRSRGLSDALIDNVSGRVVEPTAAQLAEAIRHSLNSPGEVEHLAENGYR